MNNVIHSHKDKTQNKSGLYFRFFFSFNNEIYFIDNQVIFITMNDGPDFCNN